MNNQNENAGFIRRAVPEDLPALLDIYNYEVVNGAATLDLQPKTAEERLPWLTDHLATDQILVWDADGVAVGYVTLSPYREKEAYRTTAEISLYVHPDHRRKGIGETLARAMLSKAKTEGKLHTIVSVVTGGNAASRRLHEKVGFVNCGTIRAVGKKFGVWQDIVNLEYILDE